MAIGQLDYLERYGPDEGWMLRFSASPYSWEAVKDTIKALPTKERFWNSRALGGRGAWWVSDAGLEQIKHLFINYDEMREHADAQAHTRQQQREDRQYERREQPRRNTPMTREKAFAELFLLPTAPKEVAKAVHRALAMMYHPDHGGDLERMKQINVAWDVIAASYPAEKEGR